MKYLALIVLLPIACFSQGFSEASAPLILSTSSLRKGLAGYWRLEEVLGSRYDCSKNGNVLASQGTGNIDSTNGVVGLAAVFVKTNSQRLVKADNSTLKGFTSQTLACWVNMKTVPSSGVYPTLMAKYKAASGLKEYELYFDGDLHRFVYLVGTNSLTGQAYVAANNFGLPSQDAWYFVCAWYDGANLNISVNNGTADSSANPNGIYSSTNPFCLGSDASFLAAGFLNGWIDEAGVWNRALTAAERTQLYNSGKGTHFPWAHP